MSDVENYLLFLRCYLGFCKCILINSIIMVCNIIFQNILIHIRECPLRIFKLRRRSHNFYHFKIVNSRETRRRTLIIRDDIFAILNIRSLYPEWITINFISISSRNTCYIKTWYTRIIRRKFRNIMRKYLYNLMTT